MPERISDNGAELMTWPDGGMTPFRGEKNTNLGGGYRVPMMIRWPGHIRPSQVSNAIISQEDWLPTLLAAAGEFVSYPAPTSRQLLTLRRRLAVLRCGQDGGGRAARG